MLGGPGTADVAGDVIQYDLGSIVDKIDIKTLEVNASGNLSITDTNNIIDTLGDFDLGGSLTVQAKGRTNGLKLPSRPVSTQAVSTGFLISAPVRLPPLQEISGSRAVAYC